MTRVARIPDEIFWRGKTAQKRLFDKANGRIGPLGAAPVRNRGFKHGLVLDEKNIDWSERMLRVPGLTGLSQPGRETRIFQKSSFKT